MDYTTDLLLVVISFFVCTISISLSGENNIFRKQLERQDVAKNTFYMKDINERKHYKTFEYRRIYYHVIWFCNNSQRHFLLQIKTKEVHQDKNEIAFYSILIPDSLPITLYYCYRTYESISCWYGCFEQWLLCEKDLLVVRWSWIFL